MMNEKNYRIHFQKSGLCIDLSWISIFKKNEQICGDYFNIIEENDKHILVLSDGLGSGIKANILATMTARMLGKMIAGDVPMREAIKTTADTLPMCRVRNLAYATFSILEIQEEAAYLMQYDNPDAILIRNGKQTGYPIYRSKLGEKEFHESMLQFQEDDMLILMSDGITNAGIGNTTRGGWGRKEVSAFCERVYKNGMKAADMVQSIISAGLALNSFGINDDMTVMVLHICRPQIVNLMIGPPRKSENDEFYVRRFMNHEGKHVVCGGTTAQVVAKYLGKQLKSISHEMDSELPCAMELEGIDYITEGQLTLERLLEYCQEKNEDPAYFFSAKKRYDPAMKLMNILFHEATHVNIFFGGAENQEQLDLKFSVKKKQNKVELLMEYLLKQGKEVQKVQWE